MNKKKEIVPKLRFPEFTDKWQNEKLGNIFTSRQDTGFAYLSLMSLTDESGLIPQKETNKKDSSNADKSKYLRVCKGDIVYNTMRMWQGRCAYCENEGIVSPAYTVCTPKDDCDGVFFYYYFKTYSLIQKFHANSQGLVSDTLNLRFDKFASIMINYPIKKEEQQKIADCLSSIDELINAESKKLKALEKYKKGLMQKLFPVEGKTLPEWRFPEFQGSGEWGICTVKDSFNTITPPKRIAKLEYKNSGKYPIVDQSQEYIAGWTDDETAIVSYRRPLIVFGDHTCVLKFMSQPFAQGADGIKILSTDYKLDEKFAYYCLDNIPLNSNGYQRHYSTLKEFVIKFPDRNSGEQQKIADCLSDVDTLIKKQSNKVEQLKMHKKGLMQGLFPSLEEADV